MSTTVATILKRLFEDQTIILPPCEGARTLPQARDVFNGDAHSLLWHACRPGVDTAETPVSVYELHEDANFRTMFGSLSENVESLCLTQSQIIAFCELHRDKLRTDEQPTFFLYKSSGEFFVADVRVDAHGCLSVDVHCFGSDRCWWADELRRVIVPQAL